MPIDYSSWTGKSTSGKDKSFWKKAVNLYSEKRERLTAFRNYIIQLVVDYDTGNYQDAGIYEDALVKKIFDSHHYQLSDETKQRSISMENASKSIRRTINLLVLAGYLSKKKSLDGDRDVIHSTAKGRNYWQKLLKGKL